MPSCTVIHKQTHGITMPDGQMVNTSMANTQQHVTHIKRRRMVKCMRGNEEIHITNVLPSAWGHDLTQWLLDDAPSSTTTGYLTFLQAKSPALYRLG